jgi:threonine dehydratase
MRMETQAFPTFADILQARNTIAPYLAPTPLFHYPTLDALLDAEVYVKHENYQPIGAFKVRGGINLLANLTPEEKARGVVTASTGNHGQSIAYASQIFGIKATIVVPEGANPVKVDAMRSYGATIVTGGADFETSKGYAAQLETEQGMRFISSGDEPLLITGVATHTLEIVESVPDIDMIFVPIGGGSGGAGTCLAAKSMNPDIQVVGVQSSQAPAAYLTWRDRSAHTAPIDTMAGGLATGAPFMMPQRILWALLDEFVLVDDQELMMSVRLHLEKTKTLAEPAGAAPLAAAIKLRQQVRGKKIALILSGGNISPEELVTCLEKTAEFQDGPSA